MKKTNIARGRQIKQWQQELGLDDSHFAIACLMDEETIAKMKSGKIAISGLRIEKIEERLKRFAFSEIRYLRSRFLMCLLRIKGDVCTSGLLHDPRANALCDNVQRHYDEMKQGSDWGRPDITSIDEQMKLLRHDFQQLKTILREMANCHRC